MSSKRYGDIMYTDKEHMKYLRFMYKAGLRLKISSVVLATAATIYQKFYEMRSTEDYDPHTIASTCLYLAGKVEEQHLRLRDVINVAHRLLHPGRAPLDVGPEYWQLRDSLVRGELYVMRAVGFKVNFTHPHKVCLEHLAEHVAVAVLHLALTMCGLTVPHLTEGGGCWWTAFSEELKLSDIRTIESKIMDLYAMEKELCS